MKEGNNFEQPKNKEEENKFKIIASKNFEELYQTLDKVGGLNGSVISPAQMD